MKSQSCSDLAQHAHTPRERRKSFSLGMATRAAREGTLFDHFLVVGYPPDAPLQIDEATCTFKEDPERTGAVLYTYPDSPMPYDLVGSFCFPNGVKPRLIPARERDTTLNEVLYGSLETLEDSNHSFVFVMTGTNLLLYGFCVYQFELLSDKPSFASKPFYTCTLKEENYNVVAPRCYCFLSRFPFFKLHFQVLYSILATERLHSLESRVLEVMKQSEAPTPSFPSTSSTEPSQNAHNNDTKTKKRIAIVSATPAPAPAPSASASSSSSSSTSASASSSLSALPASNKTSVNSPSVSSSEISIAKKEIIRNPRENNRPKVNTEVASSKKGKEGWFSTLKRGLSKSKVARVPKHSEEVVLLEQKARDDETEEEELFETKKHERMGAATTYTEYELQKKNNGSTIRTTAITKAPQTSHALKDDKSSILSETTQTVAASSVSRQKNSNKEEDSKQPKTNATSRKPEQTERTEDNRKGAASNVVARDKDEKAKKERQENNNNKSTKEAESEEHRNKSKTKQHKEKKKKREKNEKKKSNSESTLSTTKLKERVDKRKEDLKKRKKKELKKKEALKEQQRKSRKQQQTAKLDLSTSLSNNNNNTIQDLAEQQSSHSDYSETESTFNLDSEDERLVAMDTEDESSLSDWESSDSSRTSENDDDEEGTPTANTTRTTKTVKEEEEQKDPRLVASPRDDRKDNKRKEAHTNKAGGVEPEEDTWGEGILCAEALMQLAEEKRAKMSGSNTDNSSRNSSISSSNEASLSSSPQSREGSRIGSTRDSSTKHSKETQSAKLLKAYYSTAVSWKEWTFTLPGELRHLQFTCPEGKEEELIADWCLAATFRLLSLPDIIAVIRALMMEFKIIVICKNLGVLSCVVLSFLPLLRPFVWQGPFIPVLPESLEECVQSPVPFVIGVTSLSDEAAQAIDGECLIVDLEEQGTIYPRIELPPLPMEDELIKKLRPLHRLLYPMGKRSNKSERLRRTHSKLSSSTSSSALALNSPPSSPVLRRGSSAAIFSAHTTPSSPSFPSTSGTAAEGIAPMWTKDAAMEELYVRIVNRHRNNEFSEDERQSVDAIKQLQRQYRKGILSSSPSLSSSLLLRKRSNSIQQQTQQPLRRFTLSSASAAPQGNGAPTSSSPSPSSASPSSSSPLSTSPPPSSSPSIRHRTGRAETWDQSSSRHNKNVASSSTTLPARRDTLSNHHNNNNPSNSNNHANNNDNHNHENTLTPNQIRANVLLHPHKTKEEELELVRAMLGEIAHYQNFLIECIITTSSPSCSFFTASTPLSPSSSSSSSYVFDFASKENLESLLELFPPAQYYAFMRRFLFTQQFTVFAERLTAQMQEQEKALRERYLRRLSGQIKREEAQIINAQSLLDVCEQLGQTSMLEDVERKEVEDTIRSSVERLQELKMAKFELEESLSEAEEEANAHHPHHYSSSVWKFAWRMMMMDESGDERGEGDVSSQEES
ncbi:DENN domain containing protein [Balamuthia mandrillaris]